MSFRGAIFDLDGTLVDSLPTIAAALNHGLASLGSAPRSLADVATMVGEGVRTLCAKALPGAETATLDALQAAVFGWYEAHVLDGTTLYPGMADAVGALARRRARLGVLSNKPDRFTCRVVDGLGLLPAFAAVRGQADGVPRKPDPAGAYWVLGALGLEPRDVLYVGDTAIDLETARAAGLAFAAVTWGFRSRSVLEALGPDFLVDHPLELLAIYDAGSSPDRRAR